MNISKEHILGLDGKLQSDKMRNLCIIAAGVESGANVWLGTNSIAIRALDIYKELLERL